MCRIEGFIGKGVDGLVVFPVEFEGDLTNAVMGIGGCVAEAKRGLNRQRDTVESVRSFTFEGTVKCDGLLR